MPQATGPAEQRVIADVGQFGLHVMNILEEGELRPFSYSIGMYKTWQHPEILIYGLPNKSAHAIINFVAEAVRRGERFLPDKEYEGFLDGYKCTFRPIPQSQFREHLGWGSWFYDHTEFPALQLIYPDRSHRWPWDLGTTETFRRQQLVLADTQ